MARPTIATIKRLFAVSGNQCAFPGCSTPLVVSGTVTGEVCHIRARSPDGPRYDPTQTDEERHAFENLVLMCPVHHRIVDADPGTYTVEKLLGIKARHEARHAGGPEPGDDVAQRFLVQLGVAGDLVGGDQVLGDKVGIQIVQQAAAAAITSLHQLPSPPRDFTGRREELACLRRLVEEGGVTISGLRGMGGIGKTALPLTPAQAMAHVVRAYRPRAELPERESELRGQYHSVLHGQRALLLMDNAAGRAQVEPLVPPESCLLLVTSRQRFTLPGMRALNLDTLPPADARALLRSIADRIGDRADEMARLCGYLPLALRLAGSALAEREDLAVEEYLGWLKDEGLRLGLVDASLSLSYRLLDEGLRRFWAALAVFPGTFDRGGAAAVWGVKADRAQDALSELVRYSLVEWNQETGRYHLHDLARLFAGSRLGEEERAAARQRHAGHYEAVLRAADQLCWRGGEALLGGLTLFDLEWENVREGQAWAAGRACEAGEEGEEGRQRES